MLHQFADQLSLLANAAAEHVATAADASPAAKMSLLQEFGDNFIHNLFKPLLLFFYAGFLIPILRVKFEFPKVLYQSITIYLLLSIGWHGGEELAKLSSATLTQAIGFMVIGFFTNLIIGFLAYTILRTATNLRKVDAATVAGYYGSDSAGTFVTCVGVLSATNIAFAAYMPVMLAIMEIPGCLVALIIVARLRRHGMDKFGTMPDEIGYDVATAESVRSVVMSDNGIDIGRKLQYTSVTVIAGNGASESAYGGGESSEIRHAKEFEDDIALQEHGHDDEVVKATSMINGELLHEVFFNPGIYLLFSGILIGFISQLQGSNVTKPDDLLFVDLFPPILCLFLLEMGMTASMKLRDLASAGWQFVTFAIVAPNIFATVGICIAHAYSTLLGQPFDIGTYALFAVLCGAASYIALPAVQRMAIPEASPTLPLAASLGCTFSYNVTIGIPVYILIAKIITTSFPVVAQTTAAAAAAAAAM